jgi:threonine dehydrogenase-like Zn-dependent dehydrogenase
MHHNRIAVITSQISGVAPELQHRWGRVRLVQTVMRLAAEGRLDLTSLITQVAPATEAAQLFALVSEHPERVVQAVLDFREL